MHGVTTIHRGTTNGTTQEKQNRPQLVPGTEKIGGLHAHANAFLGDWRQKTFEHGGSINQECMGGFKSKQENIAGRKAIIQTQSQAGR